MSNSGGGGGSGSGGDSASNIYGAYAITTRLNPSMAIIIVVLLSAFFFMGFFSLYVRRCAEAATADAADGAPSGGRGNRRGSRAGGRRGLDPAVIARFPIERFSLKKAAQQMHCTCTCTDCVVCLAEFQDEEHVRVLPACGHLFHVSCIDVWLSSHTTCPLCRRSLLLSLPRPLPRPVPAESSPAAEESVAVVVDSWTGRTNAGPVQRGAVSALNSPVSLSRGSESFRRSYSTGHSLVTSCECVRGLPAMMASEKAGLHRSSSAGDTDEDHRRRLWVYPSSAEENAIAMGLGIPRSAHSWFRPR